MTAEAGNAEPVIDADNVRPVFLVESESFGRAYLDAGAAADAFFGMKNGTQADERTCKGSEGIR